MTATLGGNSSPRSAWQDPSARPRPPPCRPERARPHRRLRPYCVPDPRYLRRRSVSCPQARYRPTVVSMPQQRILTQHETRSDYLKPARRSTPLPRALVLPGDPAWLHEGITLRLLYRGQLVDLFTISTMATALGRSVGTVRRLEAQGLLPATTLHTQGRSVVGQKRLYTREQVFDAARAILNAGLYLRRPRRWSEPLLPAYDS